jgi:hypothetical protein
MPILRDLSLILLAAVGSVMALVPLALLGGLVYGLWWLRRHENLPGWLHLAQAYLSLGQAYVELATRSVVRPILQVHSFLATVRRWLGAVAKLGGKR